MTPKVTPAVRILNRRKLLEETVEDGLLKRPWRRYKPPRDEDSIMLMAKRNYKVDTFVGLNRNLLTRRISVLDTGAGPNFVQAVDLPPECRSRLRQGPLPKVTDANRNPIRMIGKIELVIQLGNWISKTSFIVCEKLTVPVILGCDFCDKFVEAIRPLRRVVELDGGTYYT